MYILWQNLVVSSLQFLLDLNVYSMAELVGKFSSIPQFFTLLDVIDHIKSCNFDISSFLQ